MHDTDMSTITNRVPGDREMEMGMDPDSWSPRLSSLAHRCMNTAEHPSTRWSTSSGKRRKNNMMLMVEDPLEHSTERMETPLVPARATR